jgi:hypothetical protein
MTCEVSLGDAGISSVLSLDLPVKIDFQRQRGSIEHGDAILAGAKMALDFTGDFGCQTSFEIFAD